MLQFLRRWFERGPRAIRTRLSREEALAIARHAAAHDSLAPQLARTTIELRAGLPVWIVTSANVGQVLEVSIDDSTGHAFQVQRLGLR